MSADIVLRHVLIILKQTNLSLSLFIPEVLHVVDVLSCFFLRPFNGTAVQEEHIWSVFGSPNTWP